MTEAEACVYLKKKKGILKRGKKQKVLLCREGCTDPFSVLNYKSAPTNFLIVPTAAVLLSPVYFSLEI